MKETGFRMRNDISAMTIWGRDDGLWQASITFDGKSWHTDNVADPFAYFTSVVDKFAPGERTKEEIFGVLSDI